MEKNIFSNPFKRFSDINFLKRSKDVTYIEINSNIFKKLSEADTEEILKVSDEKLEEYYGKIGAGN